MTVVIPPLFPRSFLVDRSLGVRVSVPLPLSLTLPVQVSPVNSASTEISSQRTSSHSATVQGQGLAQELASGQGLAPPTESTVALWSCFEVAMARCQPLSPDAIDDNTPVRTHTDKHNKTQPHAQEGEEVDTIHSRSHLVPHSRENSDGKIRQLAVDDCIDGRSGDGSSDHRSHDDMSTACFLSEMLPLLRDADKEKENKENENTSLHGGKQTPVLETKNSAALSSSSTSIPVVLSEGNLPTPPFDEAVSATTLSSLPPTPPVWMATSTPTSPSAKTYSNSTGARIATAIPSPATLVARALASSTSSRRNRNRNRTRTPLAPAAMAENYNKEDIVGGDDDVSTDVMMRMQSSSLPLQQQEEGKRKKEATEKLRHGNDDISARDQPQRPSGSDGSLRRGDDSDNNNINQSTPLDSQCSRKELSGDVEGSMNHLSSFSSSSSSTTAVAAATDNVLDEWQPNIDDCTPGQGRTLFLRTRDGRLITISTTRPVPRRVADVRALVDSFFKTPGGDDSGNLPGNMTRSTATGDDAGTHPTNEK